MAYNLAMVATGCHGIYINISTKKANLWDLAAGIYLVESVGGIVSDLQGKPIDLTLPSRSLVVAANPVLHGHFMTMSRACEWHMPY